MKCFQRRGTAPESHNSIVGQAQWVCEYILRKEDIIYVRNEEVWLLLRLNACYSVISPQLSQLQNGTSELDTAQCNSKDYSSRAPRAVLVVSLNKSPFCIITVSCHNFLKVKPPPQRFPRACKMGFCRHHPTDHDPSRATGDKSNSQSHSSPEWYLTGG